jgi:hypothetical protein
MKRLSGIASDRQLREAISDLETFGEQTPFVRVAAIHVLKNELEPVSANEKRRRILFERRYTLPGSLGFRLYRRLERFPGSPRAFLERLVLLVRFWLAGKDADLFRDTCDRYFWELMVPEVEEAFGNLAHPFLNTINEAIINYAEYSFRPWAAFRSIAVQVFCTEDELAYGIIRPRGLRQRAFNPLDLKERERPDTLGAMRRGWGHTLLMQRALFISFDHSPSRRGMMIVVGPDDPAKT